jgi:hypothetical protein
MIQCNAPPRASIRWGVLWSLAAALTLAACSSSPAEMRYSEAAIAAEEAADATPRFALFTKDLALYEATLRAQQRMTAAIGQTGLALADPEMAATCHSFEGSCGFELAFDDVVYCLGDPEPALACTSQGGGGKALGIQVQASLAEDELDNRLIHELFHVITFNRAPHARDGLFMEYSFGNERISEGTLDSVCAHFSCSQFVVEEAVSDSIFAL